MNSLSLKYNEQQSSIPDTFDSLVTKIRKTTMLLNIGNDAIHAVLGLPQGSISYASYTQLSNDFLRRSRQPLAHDFQCSRFINGVAKF
jgi:hypothetical protein